MPRFAILTHDHPHLHWDFLLEKQAVLRAWRLQFPPDHQGSIPAVPLPDHRRMYLDYEGPVSGDRGRVSRWDAGTFELIKESESTIRVRLRGTRILSLAEGHQQSDGLWEFTFALEYPASTPSE